MNDLPLIVISGLGLSALYFLLASGLSLVFGLMRVLNFAHGCFLAISAYAAWIVMREFGDGSTLSFLIATVVATLVGGAIALVTELLVIRRLEDRELEQLLATVGISTAVIALLSGIWGPDEHLVPLPGWITSTTSMLGTQIPSARLLLIASAVVVLIGIKVLLGRTRYGLVIRAGVENREMVRALGIDVRRAFTLVFTIGGLLAGLGGALAVTYYRGVTPHIGDSLLIFALIVLVIGGLGSIDGAAVAAVLMGLSQALANYYISTGAGDIVVVLLLVVTLLVRPQGIFGQKARLA